MTELQVVWASDDDSAHIHSATCNKWNGTLDIIEAGDAEEAAEMAGETLLTTVFHPCVKFKTARVRPVGKVNIDFDTMVDEEILDTLLGCRLTWWNDIGEFEERARTHEREWRNPETGILFNRNARVHESSNGRRMITFVEIDGSFRTVALDSLVDVR